MSKEEQEQLRDYILRTRGQRTSSQEIAREQLRREGVITPEGELTEPYRAGPRRAT